MKRIGIDVGGTNTDAVLLDGDRLVHAVKTETTEDVTDGIQSAMGALVAATGAADGVDAVMIGTTHYTNAVVQRRDLTPVAAVRIGRPASASLPPFVDWPDDLAALVRGRVVMVAGGHEYDGRPIVPFDERGMRDAARAIRDAGITSVAVASVFSPLTAEHEIAAGEILQEECPGVRVTLSHRLGRIGLLERENAALLNASVVDLAERTHAAFQAALERHGLDARLFITQNDGTVARADVAARFPVFSFASGPTNSMRGAAVLSKLHDAMVVDVGGTTSDVGCLRAGFPRQANGVVTVGGVRTLFRMPDLVSLALGGGTILDGDRIGPASVGYRLTRQALVFGGDVVTATDVAVAAGLARIGATGAVRDLEPERVAAWRDRMHGRIADGVDRMRTDAAEVPLVAVGGAAFLVPNRMPGIVEVVRVEHHEVANAVGAATAQMSGEVDQVFTGLSRAAAIDQATALAMARVEEAGASLDTADVVEVDDIPLAYLPGDARRVRVRVVGDVGARPAAGRSAPP